MSQHLPFRFNRLEVAGALGDLGSLLPITMAMVLVNGISPVGIFFSIAVFYIASGLFFRVTVPVQPMKIIAAYAISTAMSASEIFASSLLMAFFLLVIGLTGSLKYIKKYTPTSVVCGIQTTTGVLLILGGLEFIIGASPFQLQLQSPEPYLKIQSLGPLPIGIPIAIIAGFLTFLFLHNRRFPAGLILIIGGAIIGFILGARPELQLSLQFPELFLFSIPSQVDFTFALFALVLPQLPMTIGNAVLAYSDLSKKYFAEKSFRVTNKNSCLSMAGANIFSFIFGGIPLCHGAGGLAAHYQFGARSAASNLIIGGGLGILTLLLGEQIIQLFHLLPMAILGVLLIFAGIQLSSSIKTLKEPYDSFIVLVILLITLMTNLAYGFIIGLLVAHLVNWQKHNY